MLLEQACGELEPTAALPQLEDETGLLQADWSGLLPVLMDNRRSIAERASYFHAVSHTPCCSRQ